MKFQIAIILILLLIAQNCLAYSDAYFTSVKVGWKNNQLYFRGVAAQNLTNFYLGSDSSGSTCNFVTTNGRGISVYQKYASVNVLSGATVDFKFGKKGFCGYSDKDGSQIGDPFSKTELLYYSGGVYDLAACIESGTDDLTHIYTLRYYTEESGTVTALSYPSNMIALETLTDPVTPTSTSYIPVTSVFAGLPALIQADYFSGIRSFVLNLFYIFALLLVLNLIFKFFDKYVKKIV